MPMKPTFAVLPENSAPADALARGPLDAALCGKREQPAPTPASLRVSDLLRREARLALALMPAAYRKPLAEEWCSTVGKTQARGPEWLLRFRDKVYRLAGATD